MKLLPLVVHAQLYLPRWTSMFSDPLAATNMVVVAGGLTTINLAAPHGIAVGQKASISVTDAETPNPIVAANVNGAGNVVVTTQYSHWLSGTPDPKKFRAWSDAAKFGGFTNPVLNGSRQVVSIPAPNQIEFMPGGAVSSISLNGAEKFLDRIEGGLTGWHSAAAASTTTLTFPTPDSVTRSFTVLSPVVVTGIRIAAALNYETALAQLTFSGDGKTITRAYLFILPHPVRTSRSRLSRGDGLADIKPGLDFRMQILDGFTLLAFLPSVGTAAHAKAIDLAQGQLFKAMLRTFNGLNLKRSELACGDSFVALFESHQGASVANRAVYAHEWIFQQQAVLTNEDAIAPWQWAVIDDEALENGEVPTSIETVTTSPLDQIQVEPGIAHYGHRSKLTGNFEVE